MRDVLIHQYFDVDLELTWEVVQVDIPKLKMVVGLMKEDLDTG
ncbi:MAG: HepT-like ribonuclease domain-containing protein [Methanotrichaceae archaeon]